MQLSSKTLIPFDTNQLIPLTLTDKIEDLYVINHQIQLKTQCIVGNVIISTTDHRIFVAHHGRIAHELTMDHLITKIHFYHTIEDEQLFLFFNEDLKSVEIFHYEHETSLTSYLNTHHTADQILFDDFTQIGWKQILFIKNHFDLDAFVLTDFCQIHVFQHHYHVCITKTKDQL